MGLSVRAIGTSAGDRKMLQWEKRALDGRMVLAFRSTVLPAYRQVLAAPPETRDGLSADANATAEAFLATWSKKYTAYAAKCGNQADLAGDATAMQTQMKHLTSAYAAVHRIRQMSNAVDALIQKLFYKKNPNEPLLLREDVSPDDLESAAREAQRLIKELEKHSTAAQADIGNIQPHLATLCSSPSWDEFEAVIPKMQPLVEGLAKNSAAALTNAGDTQPHQTSRWTLPDYSPVRMHQEVIEAGNRLQNNAVFIIDTLCQNVHQHFESLAKTAFDGRKPGISEARAEALWLGAEEELPALSMHTEALEHTTGHALSGAQALLAEKDLDVHVRFMIERHADILHGVRATMPLLHADALGRKLIWLKDFLLDADGNEGTASSLGVRYTNAVRNMQALDSNVRDFHYYTSGAAPWPECVPHKEKLLLLEHIVEKTAWLREELSKLRQDTIDVALPMSDRAAQTLAALDETVGTLQNDLTDYARFLETESKISRSGQTPLPKECYEAMLKLMAPERHAQFVANAVAYFDRTAGERGSPRDLLDQEAIEQEWRPAEAALEQLSAHVKAVTRTAECAVAMLHGVLERGDVDEAWADAAKRDAKNVYITQTDALMREGSALNRKLEWLTNLYATGPAQTGAHAETAASFASASADMLKRLKWLNLDVDHYLKKDSGSEPWPPNLASDLRLPLLLLILQKLQTQGAELRALLQHIRNDESPLGRHIADALQTLLAHNKAYEQCLSAYSTDLQEEERRSRPAGAPSDALRDREELIARMGRASLYAVLALHSFRNVGGSKRKRSID